MDDDPAIPHRSRLFRRNRPKPAGRARLNLALQGGGAHGAFTWGVLDRLLERGHFAFDGLSGTSAGAVNAVALAAGLAEGGEEGARQKLAQVWREISTAGCFFRFAKKLGPDGPPVATAESSPGYRMLHLMTQMLSPYDLRPFDQHPLHDVLANSIDFAQLREAAPVKLFVAATEVSTGRAHIFENKDLTLDAVLASACLPSLHKAVQIGRRHYWDGGFSANPPLLPLIRGCDCEDTLIVQITPMRERELPRSAEAIVARVNRITFNQPLRKEIELILESRRRRPPWLGIGDPDGRRLRAHRFHVVDAEPYLAELGVPSRMIPDWDLLVYLRDRGRTAVDSWFRRKSAAVGEATSVDLPAKFL